MFNRRLSIGCCIDSVSALDCPHVEHVIVDGASADGTVDVLGARTHQIARWVSEPDGGVYDAMNKGVAMARGKWILFVGADDIVLPTLKDMIPHLRDTSNVYYGDVLMPARRRIYGGHFGTFRLLLDNICHQAILYPAALLRAHPFDTRFSILADYALNLRLYGAAPERFVYIPAMTAVHVDSGGLSSELSDQDFLREKPQIIREHFSRWWVWLYHTHKSVVKWLAALGLRDHLMRILRW